MSQTNIEVKLTNIKGAGPISARRSSGEYVKDKSAFEIDSAKFSIWGVWKFSFDRLQYAYNRFITSKTKDSSWLRGFDWSDPKTRSLVKDEFDNSLYVFTGIDLNGTFIIIPDVNQNKNFSDEIFYQYRSTKVPSDSANLLADKLPITQLNVTTWNKNHLDTVNIFVRFIPNQFTGLTLNEDYEANRLRIYAERQDYLHGNFNIEHKSFDIFMRNSTVDARYIDKSEINILVVEKNSSKKAPKLHNDYEAYTAKDSIPISNNVYTIEKIDPLGKSLVLKFSGKNKGIGISNGSFAKNISGTDIINNKKIDLQKYIGQYVLLDFWGTWCAPCKETVPLLKHIDSQYSRSGLKMISIAYDKDVTTVKEYITHEKITWINLFQPSDYLPASQNITGDYKVTSYPTFILIDPKGKIIFRSVGTVGATALHEVLKSRL